MMKSTDHLKHLDLLKTKGRIKGAQRSVALLTSPSQVGGLPARIPGHTSGVSQSHIHSSITPLAQWTRGLVEN